MNVLLTSVGRRTYMIDYFKKALSNQGIVYAANSVYTYALKSADHYVITPNIYDNDYVSFLLNYCKSNAINVIISLFDIDLPVLASNKTLFENNGIRVIVSDYDITQICNDKWLTYHFLLKNGFPQPKTYIDIDSCKYDLNHGNLNFPVFLKPRWGMGSIAIYKAETELELTVFYDKVKREILSSYLKFESNADIDQSIILQEALIGQEYGIEILNDLEANYVCTFAKEKIAMRAGETDIAKIIDYPALESIGKDLSLSLRHIANLDVDCFIVDDLIYILEINCRFGGQYPFSHLAGANIPALIIDWLNHKGTNRDYITLNHDLVICKDLNPVVLYGE